MSRANGSRLRVEIRGGGGGGYGWEDVGSAQKEECSLTNVEETVREELAVKNVEETTREVDQNFMNVEETPKDEEKTIEAEKLLFPNFGKSIAVDDVESSENQEPCKARKRS